MWGDIMRGELLPLALHMLIELAGCSGLVVAIRNSVMSTVHTADEAAHDDHVKNSNSFFIR